MRLGFFGFRVQGFRFRAQRDRGSPFRSLICFQVSLKPNLQKPNNLRLRNASKPFKISNKPRIPKSPKQKWKTQETLKRSLCEGRYGSSARCGAAWTQRRPAETHAEKYPERAQCPLDNEYSTIYMYIYIYIYYEFVCLFIFLHILKS